MKLPDIENLSKKQLRDLNLQIENKLYGFWGCVDELIKVKKEATSLSTYIKSKEGNAKAKSKQMQYIEQLGFTIVLYDEKRVGIINYTKSKNDSYYGVDFCKETNAISYDMKDKPSDEDIQKIKEILEIPQ